jgi:hypothetical protein
MRLRLVKQAFDNPDFIFELKHDGFRAVVYIERGECRLGLPQHAASEIRSSKGAQLPVKNAIHDSGFTFR